MDRNVVPEALPRVLVVLGIVALTSCASPEADRVEFNQVVALPTEWHGAKLTPHSGSMPSVWGVELPVEIQQLLTVSLQDNLQLQVSHLNLLRAEQDLHIATGELWPAAQVSLNQRNFQTLNDQHNTLDETSSSGLSVSWEVDLWRRLAFEKQQKVWQLHARESELLALQHSIQAQVLLTWFDIVEQNNLLQLNYDNTENQQRRLEMSLIRLDNGLASSIDVRNVRTLLMRTQESQKTILYRRDQAIRKLNVLLARNPSTDFLQSLQLPELTDYQALSAPKDILLNRPDLKVAEARLLAAGFAWKVSEKKKLPKLNVNLNFEARRDNFSELFDFDYWLGSVSAALVQPIFYRNILDAEAKKAEFNQQIELENFKDKLLQAWKEVEDALQNELLLKQRKSLLDQALLEATSAEDQTENQYNAGLVSSFELLAAQRTRTALETDQIRVAIARVKNRIQLQLALGLPQVTDA